ncbi:MAG: hypothetical protein H7Y86_05060 [Rhizobacter sp.]|nr:hypothetical protein [Ferruginibacter sp.]
MQNLLQIIAGIIGFITYCFLCFKILKSKAEQNFAAFLLWAILSIITTITVSIEEGNYWLSLGNVLGETAIAILLIVKKKIAWKWIETLTALLVIICLVIWFFAGEKAAIVSSSLATIIASVPQMASTYKKPSQTPTGIYVSFLLANLLSLYAGKSWTIEERFYPASAVVICLVIAIFSIKAFYKPFGFRIIKKSS